MAQHDYVIANQGFPAFRSDLNDALAAIVSNNSGATEPATMFAHQMWVDTAADPSVLKIRNADNDAWITIGSIDQTGDTFILRPAAGSATVPAYSTTSDTNTGVYFPGADRVGITTGGTQRVEVDASGNVSVGTSTALVTAAGRGNITINGSSSSILALGTSASLTGYLFHNGADMILQNDVVGYLSFVTSSGSPTERARITSGGYFKASNTGSYYGVTENYHELRQSASEITALISASNASFSQIGFGIFGISATRSATSAYNFASFYSGGDTDREFQFRGDGNAYADGSWNGSGADYAEYFESAGETIPRGTTVVLDNNKVRAATENDPASSIIGVVRPKEFGKGSMVVGNLAWNMWTDKYITDDFGVYEMEDHDVLEWEETITDEEGKTSTKQHSYESHEVPEGVTVPADATRKTHDEKGKKFQHRKLNPAWSADVEYTPREERPEWHIIGLLGQVPVLKGQPVGDRWIKMRDISETVEEWFIR